MALGAIQAYNGYQGLQNINRTPRATYSITPEQQNSYNRAEGMAGQGYTGQESANFHQGLAQSNNTAFRNAVDMSGGNLAGAIHRGINAQNVGALNTFASNDANLHRQNIRYADQQGQNISNQRNLITQNAQQRRDMLENAYGGALSSGLNNLTSGFNLQGSPVGALGSLAMLAL